MAKKLFKPMTVPGYETDLEVNGVHYFGRNYKFSIITQAECDELIAMGVKHIRKIEKPVKGS